MTDREIPKLPSQISFITVVYEPEILLLKLQARSIRSFFNLRQVGRIIVIVNDLAPEGTYSAFAKEVLPEYGDLQRKLTLIPYTNLMTPQIHANGWRRQQSIKLLASKLVETPHYVALDAKNHFLRPFSVRDFIDKGTGLMRTFKVREHGSLNGSLVNCLNYFGVSQLEHSLPATTPYVLSTRTVRDLVAEVEKRENSAFESFMHKPGNNYTEFFLYYAYIRSKLSDIESLYRFGPRRTVSMFTRFPTNRPQIDALLKALADDRTLCFGLHKNRVGALIDEDVSAIASVWAKRGLFPSYDEAVAFYRRLEDQIRPLPA